MQDRIKINEVDIYQPDEGLDYNFESTYTSDSTRVQSGHGHFTPLFTVEQLGFTASNLPVSEASKILKLVAKGNYFTLHYFSLYYGIWRDDTFYVGKGSGGIKTLKINEETVEELSFNMTGVNPLL